MADLFIGGPLDGQFIEVDPYRKHVEVAIDHNIVGTNYQGPEKVTDIFYYKRQTLDCPTVQWNVFVPRSYSCADLILALIQGYRPDAPSQNQ
jgi:hypothetical protein